MTVKINTPFVYLSIDEFTSVESRRGRLLRGGAKQQRIALHLPVRGCC